MTDLYDYLTQGHDPTTVGIFLGARSASSLPCMRLCAPHETCVPACVVVCQGHDPTTVGIFLGVYCLVNMLCGRGTGGNARGLCLLTCLCTCFVCCRSLAKCRDGRRQARERGLDGQQDALPAPALPALLRRGTLNEDSLLLLLMVVVVCVRGWDVDTHKHSQPPRSAGTMHATRSRQTTLYTTHDHRWKSPPSRRRRRCWGSGCCTRGRPTAS